MVFFSFFVWPVNCSSLICKLWILFWTFELTVQDVCLNSIVYFALFYTEKSISTVATFLATICCSINCMSWMTLNYKTYFRHSQRLKHHLNLQPLFNLFSFKESSILPIKYVFSLLWSLNYTGLICKLYISVGTILEFWEVLILEGFYIGIFWNIIFNS